MNNSILLSIVMVFFCGCLPLGYGYNSATIEGRNLARQTLDISYSQPDLIIVESPQKVIHILKEIGLDNKFTGKKFILYGISISYDLNAPRSSYDHIFVFRDETSGWVNMTIIKAMDGKVLLWIRKPTCDDFEPTPGSAYYKDWLTVTKQELSKRGIQFE